MIKLNLSLTLNYCKPKRPPFVGRPPCPGLDSLNSIALVRRLNELLRQTPPESPCGEGRWALPGHLSDSLLPQFGFHWRSFQPCVDQAVSYDTRLAGG